MASKDLLYAWLRDAHGMEKAIADFAKRAVNDFEDEPDYQDVIRSKVAKTEGHQAAIEDMLKNVDEKASTSKDLMAKLASFVSGMGSSMFTDDRVKNLLVLHGALHFAHACYVSLCHGAKSCDEMVIASTCERIATEKEEMAKTILEMIPEVTELALANKND